MQLKKEYKWAIVAPTSMGIRITPEIRQPVYASNQFLMQVTSAESNVLSVSSYLGLSAKVLSAFVKDSPISQMIKQNLLSRNIAYEGRDYLQGGPWGFRHQFNIADSGYGVRGPRVHNDRAGEVGREMKMDDFDLETLFVKEGVGILHLSGLICALSCETGALCVELAKHAKQNGTLVSFDLNYRASFWKGREKELSKIFETIAGLSDILLGNEEDFQLALKIAGPETGGTDIASKIESFKEMMRHVKKEYPNATVFATTLRQVLSANAHMWGAVMLAGDEWFEEAPREITVLDRIGGGDGFVGGLLYGILKQWNKDEWLKFGWASGAFATTCLSDYVQPCDEEQIWEIYKGNARVKR